MRVLLHNNNKNRVYQFVLCELMYPVFFLSSLIYDYSSNVAGVVLIPTACMKPANLSTLLAKDADIDEVHLDMDDDCKYALVIQDFHTGNPIDLLRSRRTSATEPYFIPLLATERNQV